MSTSPKFRTALLITSLIPLAACGPTDVASPGDGVIIVPAPTPPAPPPPPPPPGVNDPAAACPTIAGITLFDRNVTGTKRVCELPGRFTADTTLPNAPGVAYQIAGPVNIGTDCGGDPAAPLAGCQAVTLTINPGTLLVGEGTTAYLVANRGSRLVAAGSAASPIIFTAKANLTSGGVTESSQGLWGGVILLGRAPISDCNTAVAGGSVNCQQVIEGTTSSLYGGASPNDNSGIVSYVQIRYSGVAIAPGNELQGLTMGGVGQLTQVDHVQIHNSSDDGIEIFGGRVNLKHIVITGADDDGLDTDLGYRGTTQFLLAVQRDTSNGDSMIEADSNGNEDALPRQYNRVSNATFVQRSTVQGLNTLLMRGGTDYALLNSVVVGTTNCLDIDGTAGTTTRAADAALQDLGAPVFRSVVMSCTNPFTNDGNLQAETATAFGTGTNNNNSVFTPSLTSVFINGANETAVPVTDPTAFNADIYAGAGQPNAAAPNRLSAVTYIGAVQNAADTWYQGWTCTVSWATIGGGSRACTGL
jgi:hypothetical protein